MNLTVAEIVESLQHLNGLQHLGQMAGYHLMVDESEWTYWQSTASTPFQSFGGSFSTAHQAWFDCMYQNFNRKLLLAMWLMASQQLTIHPQAIEAYQGWLGIAKPSGGPN